MLVLGYQGTLQLDRSAHHPLDVPPEMEVLVEPLLAEAHRRLNQGSMIFAGEPLPLASLLRLLRERLYGILTLPLADRLAASDRTAQSFEPALPEQFPVLSRLLAQAVFEFVDAVWVFQRRLQRDSTRLAAWLRIPVLPPIASITGTNADTHTGGHTVLQVVFHGGICIYYKPRSVTGEWLWHRLLDEIANAEPGIRLPAARVLEGSASSRYGWSASIPRDDTRDASVTKRFNPQVYWHAAGAVLCLAYHAGVTDLHMGNILATPSGPAVTDAECLASMPYDHFRSGRDHSTEAFDPVATMLQSLTSTGLLCSRGASALPEVSGLFGRASRVAGITLPRWEIAADGRYDLCPAAAVLLDHANAPAVVSPLTVLPHLLEGYRNAADLLIRCRPRLTAHGSTWRAVLQTRHAPRLVLRDTLSYGLLLSRSLEPEYLRSQGRRQRMIWSALEGSAPLNLPRALLRSEVHSLLDLHVPKVHIAAGGTSIVNGAGRRLAQGLTVASPAIAVLQKLEELSPKSTEAVHIPALLLACLRA
jgi:lantibiotic modifying enzyme